jgi:hypothetical protein
MQHFVLRGFEKCEKLKKCSKVVIVYFDIAKAFDTVPHQKMLSYLSQKYLLPQSLLKIIDSYLSGRWMTVKVGNTYSKKTLVTSGVPQGSVLGPLLFTAYINAISEIQLNPGSELIMYADDMCLCHPLIDESSTQHLQEDVNRVNTKIEDLELRLNIGKCKYQILTLQRNASSADISLTLKGENLERTSCYQYLGINIDDHLSFSSQSNKAAIKTKSAIGVLNRTLRKWAPKEVFREAVVKIALPIFFYGIEVWFPPAEKDKNRLEHVLKFAARLSLNNFDHNTTYQQLLSSLKWKSVARLVTERRLLTIKRYMDGDRFIPEFVFPLETEPTTRYSQRIRNQNSRKNIILATFNSQTNSLENKLSAAQMRKLWNTLNDETIVLRFPIFKSTILGDDFFIHLSGTEA